MDQKNEQFEQLKKLAESLNQKNSHPCPSCGHCPTCGRGGYYMRPWPYYQPMWVADYENTGIQYQQNMNTYKVTC